MNRPREWVPDQLGEALLQANGYRLVCPSSQERAVRLRQSFADSDNLVRGLPLAEDNLGLTLPESAVMIDSCERKVFEGEVPQSFERRARGNAAGRNVGEQVFELLGCHATWATGSRYSRKISSASAMDSIWKSR